MRIAAVGAMLLMLAVPLFALEHVVLQLQWLPQFQFAGYYMAKEKGFYRDAGLDVEIRPYREGIDVLSDVLSGRAQFGTGRSSLLIAYETHQPVVAMAAIFQSSPMVLLARKDSGIRTVEDLRGKRVMLTDDVQAAASTQSLLRSAGLDEDDLVVQPHTLDPFSLERNETDAMAAYLSNEPYALKEHQIETVAIDPKEYGFDFYSDILFTSKNELKQNPELSRHFYEASLRGWQYAFTHIEETAALLAKKYNPQKKTVQALIYEGEVLRKLAYKPGVALGEINPDRLSAIGQAYSLLGFLKGKCDFDGFIYHPERLIFSTEEKEWLAAHPNIRIGVNPEWSPVEYLGSDGSYRGVVSGYMELIARKLGVTFEVQPYTRGDTVTRALAEHSLDVGTSMMRLPEREGYADFTRPYLKLPLVIVGGKGLKYVGDLSMLRGKTVSVVGGYAVESMLRRDYPGIKLLEADNVKEALEKVERGEADAAIDALAVVSYVIAREEYTQLKVVGQTPYTYDIAMAVRSDWEILRELLQQALNSITPEERAAIYRTWVPTEYEQRVDYSLIRRILATVFVIGLIFWYKYSRLDFLVKKRTAQLEELNATLQERIDGAVAENRSKDRMMIQQAKMATIGEMIESIAHQWRQPLNIMGIGISNVAFKRHLGTLEEEELERLLDLVQRQVSYMSQTIDDFRNFFKKDKQKERVELEGVIGEVAMLVTPMLERTGINMEVDVPSDLVVYIYPNELKQVILNLINNAKDALLQSGNEKRDIFIRARADEQQVCIDVEDTGGGIAPEIMDKVFDPYFTTKFEAQGTGIGLYMSQTIIEKHFGGRLEVENAAEGACFTIVLPQSVLQHGDEEVFSEF